MSLLKVKTSIPPLGSEMVSRPHLEKRMNQGLICAEGFGRRLTLVSAPAGFGKTTLVRQWLRECEPAVAWYSLDCHDNQVDRFWIYLISALQMVKSNLGEASLAVLRSHPMVRADLMARESRLNPLLNEMLELDDQIYLVLDDYHLITDPNIHADLTFFVENLPPSVHLIVATRSAPPWPLSRWRLRK